MCEMFKPHCVVDENNSMQNKKSLLLLDTCSFVSLSYPGYANKHTFSLHYKQIMSNCKCVCFLKRGWCKGEWRFPPSHQVALPCLPAAPLGWGLILVVAALLEIKMCTPLPIPHSLSLSLRSTYVGEWTGPVLAHMLVIVNTYA